jgi:SPP1 Gp6-like portal protein
VPFDVTPIMPPPGNGGIQSDIYGWEAVRYLPVERFEAGTPQWWLNRGISAIQVKQNTHIYRKRMVDGDHRPPNGDKRYVKALADFQYKAKTNYIELVTYAPIQRMRIKDFRFGSRKGEDEKTSPGSPGRTSGVSKAVGTNPSVRPPDDGADTGASKPRKSSGGSDSIDSDVLSQPMKAPNTNGDPDARKVWMANDMDYQMENLLLDCATYGEGYLLVSEVDEDTDEPKITVESPRVCHVFPDPTKPTRSLAGVRIWQDDVIGRVMAVLYLPEATMVFMGPENSSENTVSTALQVEAFSLVAVEENPTGEVTLVRARWKPDGTAEAENVYSVQDRINLTILDRMVVSKSQAYRQRWMTGGQIAERYKKRVGPGAQLAGQIDQKPPFDPGADTLWHVPAHDAKFGDFDQADITQILEAVRDDVVDMASLTQTPAHYLMGRMANVSGDTLVQAESGFVAKVKMRSRSVGWAVEKAMRLVFKYKGEEEKAKEAEAEIIWMDPEVRPLSEKADAAMKFASAFSSAPPFLVPILAEMMNLDPDQIEMLTENAAVWQAQQMAMQQQMMQQQTEGAIEVAKVGGRPKPGQAPSKTPSTGSSSTPK